MDVAQLSLEYIEDHSGIGKAWIAQHLAEHVKKSEHGVLQLVQDLEPQLMIGPSEAARGRATLLLAEVSVLLRLCVALTLNTLHVHSHPRR